MGSHKHKHPPGSGFPAQNLPGKFGGIGCTKWIVLHSPRASTPGAVSYHGSSGLKPLPVPHRNGSVFPTQPPDQGVSAKKLTGKDGEVGDTECRAAPSRGYAASTKSLGGICLNPEKPTNPSSQLRNSRVWTERCETQNPKHLLRAPASKP